MKNFVIAFKRRASKADGKTKQVTNQVCKFKLRKATVDCTFAAEHCVTMSFRKIKLFFIYIYIFKVHCLES